MNINFILKKDRDDKELMDSMRAYIEIKIGNETNTIIQKLFLLDIK